MFFSELWRALPKQIVNKGVTLFLEMGEHTICYCNMEEDTPDIGDGSTAFIGEGIVDGDIEGASIRLFGQLEYLKIACPPRKNTFQQHLESNCGGAYSFQDIINNSDAEELSIDLLDFAESQEGTVTFDREQFISIMQSINNALK